MLEMLSCLGSSQLSTTLIMASKGSACCVCWGNRSARAVTGRGTVVRLTTAGATGLAMLLCLGVAYDIRETGALTELSILAVDCLADEVLLYNPRKACKQAEACLAEDTGVAAHLGF